MSSLDEIVDARIAASLEKLTGSSRWLPRKSSPLPKKTLGRLVRGGVIRAARIGSVVLLDRDQHDAYIAAHAIAPAAAKKSPANQAHEGAENEEDDDVLAAFGVVRAS